jgi:hypothetical protein
MQSMGGLGDFRHTPKIPGPFHHLSRGNLPLPNRRADNRRQKRAPDFGIEPATNNQPFWRVRQKGQEVCALHGQSTPFRYLEIFPFPGYF